MHKLISSLIIFFSLQLSSCSTTSVQIDRINSAESYLFQAEYIVNNSTAKDKYIIANERLGTAKAYLETLRDNKKFLTSNELKRYKKLKQRVKSLSIFIHNKL